MHNTSTYSYFSNIFYAVLCPLARKSEDIYERNWMKEIFSEFQINFFSFKEVSIYICDRRVLKLNSIELLCL